MISFSLGSLILLPASPAFTFFMNFFLHSIMSFPVNLLYSFNHINQSMYCSFLEKKNKQNHGCLHSFICPELIFVFLVKKLYRLLFIIILYISCSGLIFVFLVKNLYSLLFIVVQIIWTFTIIESTRHGINKKAR